MSGLSLSSSITTSSCAQASNSEENTSIPMQLQQKEGRYKEIFQILKEKTNFSSDISSLIVIFTDVMETYTTKTNLFLEERIISILDYPLVHTGFLDSPLVHMGFLGSPFVHMGFPLVQAAKELPDGALYAFILENYGIGKKRINLTEEELNKTARDIYIFAKYIKPHGAYSHTNFNFRRPLCDLGPSGYDVVFQENADDDLEDVLLKGRLPNFIKPFVRSMCNRLSPYLTEEEAIEGLNKSLEVRPDFIDEELDESVEILTKEKKIANLKQLFSCEFDLYTYSLDMKRITFKKSCQLIDVIVDIMNKKGLRDLFSLLCNTGNLTIVNEIIETKARNLKYREHSLKQTKDTIVSH